MTTPAVSENKWTWDVFVAKWYYGGVHYPNGDLRVTMSTSRNYRQRPESIPGGKIDGLWPLKPWFNTWAWGNSTYKSWTAYNKAAPHDRYVFESAPFLGMDHLVGSAVRVAPFLDGGLFPVNLESQARRDFLAELAGTKWELGTTLAEAKETAGFLGDLAGELHRVTRSLAHRAGTKADRVAQILSDIDFNRAFCYGMSQREIDYAFRTRRGRRETGEARQRADSKFGRQTVSSLASAWLGVQFGLKPMFQDLADATVQLNNLVSSEASGVKLRTSVTKGNQERVVDPYQIDSAVLSGSAEVHWVVDSAITIVGDYVLDDRMLRSARQLALTGQASLAYEVMRYSVFIDYVVDIGGWLKSLDAPLGLRCTGASISRTQKLKPYLIRPRNNYMGYDGLKAYEPDECEIGRTSRELVSQVYPGLPPLGDMLNVTQALNVLAQLVKLIGR